MATPAQWVQGARPRTLPAAVAPVLAGTAIAAYYDAAVWWKALLALVVSLALQVGVNYANDYSDGIRGTDDDRVGPLRLTGSKLATPAAVKRAAFLAFGVAAGVGLVLAATTAWWLVGVGALCVLAAWFYTGGSSPYGYLGLGEVMVFVFFGLVAVLGTVYVQVHDQTLPPGHHAPAAALLAAVAVGALACAILVANNLRDIPTDAVAGKRTLAVKLGAERTRYLYAFLVAGAQVALLGIAVLTSPWAALGLLALLLLVPATRTVLSGATGPGLVPVLQQTGLGELVHAAGLFVGLLIAR
jgi:1,4-dihydroxy-2-naphthoate octaprenyltransferase